MQLTTDGEIEIKRITIDEVIDKETTSEKPIEVIESEAKDAQGNLVSLTSIGYAVSACKSVSDITSKPPDDDDSTAATIVNPELYL